VSSLFSAGVVAQQESFDPKPYAPLEYRGPLNSIGTSITGVRFGEMFKRTEASRGQASRQTEAEIAIGAIA